MFDRKCPECGQITLDCWEAISAPDPLCLHCLTAMPRTWLPGKTNGVIADSIPGGLEVSNGLCWPDGKPRRFDSHSEIRKAAAERGLVQRVEHVPSKGSDKSKFTSRWTGCPTISEEERLRHWHAHEAQMTHSKIVPFSKNPGEIAVGVMPAEEFTFDAIVKQDLLDAWQLKENR